MAPRPLDQRIRNAERERKRRKQSTPEERAERAEKMREWHRRHPLWRRENYAKRKAAGTRWRDRHPEWYRLFLRRSHLKKTYGITLEEYDRLFALQSGVCAICQQSSSKTLHVDHDHATGRVRGLLCYTCNRFLMAKPDLKYFERAIEYLKRN